MSNVLVAVIIVITFIVIITIIIIIIININIFDGILCEKTKCKDKIMKEYNGESSYYLEEK